MNNSNWKASAFERFYRGFFLGARQEDPGDGSGRLVWCWAAHGSGRPIWHPLGTSTSKIRSAGAVRLQGARDTPADARREAQRAVDTRYKEH